jgi:hypothetical protein
MLRRNLKEGGPHNESNSVYVPTANRALPKIEKRRVAFGGVARALYCCSFLAASPLATNSTDTVKDELVR